MPNPKHIFMTTCGLLCLWLSTFLMMNSANAADEIDLSQHSQWMNAIMEKTKANELLFKGLRWSLAGGCQATNETSIEADRLMAKLDQEAIAAHYRELVEPQLSEADMAAYATFLQTAAGQHWVDLTLHAIELKLNCMPEPDVKAGLDINEAYEQEIKEFLSTGSAQRCALAIQQAQQSMSPYLRAALDKTE